MHTPSITFTLLLWVLLTGCASRRTPQLAAPAVTGSMDKWLAAVGSAVENPMTGKPTDAKARRDLAISYTSALVMARYESVKTSLLTGRAATAITFDVLGLGLTTSVPIVNGTRGKTILGALAAGLTGTQLSVDRNLFQQQTTSALLAAMETCVSRQMHHLKEQRTLAVGDYSVYDGYSDLVRLYGCTTLAGAIEELSETQAVAARQEKGIIALVAPVTGQERDDMAAVQAAFIKSAEGDKTAAVAFLTALGVKGLSDTSTREQLVDAYRTIGPQTLSDPKFRAQFFTAARGAGLLPKQ